MCLYNYATFLAEAFSVLMLQYTGVLQSTVRFSKLIYFFKKNSRLKIIIKLKSLSFTSILSDLLEYDK